MALIWPYLSVLLGKRRYLTIVRRYPFAHASVPSFINGLTDLTSSELIVFRTHCALLLWWWLLFVGNLLIPHRYLLAHASVPSFINGLTDITSSKLITFLFLYTLHSSIIMMIIICVWFQQSHLIITSDIPTWWYRQPFYSFLEK